MYNAPDYSYYYYVISYSYSSELEGADQVISLDYPCFRSDDTWTLYMDWEDDIFTNYDGVKNELTFNFQYSLFDGDDYYEAYAAIFDSLTGIY